MKSKHFLGLGISDTEMNRTLLFSYLVACNMSGKSSMATVKVSCTIYCRNTKMIFIAVVDRKE